MSPHADGASGSAGRGDGWMEEQQTSCMPSSTIRDVTEHLTCVRGREADYAPVCMVSIAEQLSRCWHLKPF